MHTRVQIPADSHGIWRMRSRGALLALLVAVTGMVAMMGSAPVQASAQAETVVRLSPLGAIVEQSRAMVRAGIRDGLVATGQVDALVAETIAGFGASAFDATRIRSRLVNDLATDLSDDQLRAVERWYQSDLGQQLSGAESAAARPVAWKAMTEVGPALSQQYEGSARQRLFGRYDRALGATEQATETAVAVQLQLAEAMAALSQGTTAQSIQDRVQASRPLLRSEIGHQVYLAYLHMYRSFSDQQLETYVAFLESPAGRAFTDSAGTSVRNAVMQPVSMVGGQLVRLLGSGRE